MPEVRIQLGLALSTVSRNWQKAVQALHGNRRFHKDPVSDDYIWPSTT